jgi:ubiquinone biosynthesis protein UbiJ
MKLPLFPAPINHVLRANSWALERLKAHAGQIVRVNLAPFDAQLAIVDSGEIASAPPDASPDVTVSLSPGLMLRLTARDASVWDDIPVSGDAQFAATLSVVGRNLRWDIEEDLSRVFGDIAAHRMAETGRTLERWGREGADNVARAFTEYWTEEQPLLTGRLAVEQFNREIDTLRDDLARLEKRIDALAR